MKNTSFLWSMFLSIFFMSCEHGCSYKDIEAVRISGQTMGTFYSVVIVNDASVQGFSSKNIKEDIDKRLEEINNIFSTYRPNSTISKFNDLKNTEKMMVEKELLQVLHRSLEISSLTQGAFNICVDPLIDLWGFDRSGRIVKKPEKWAIDDRRQLTDFTKIKIDGDFIAKLDPKISINLSAIVKGYAVDDIARLLSNLSFNNFMVEIGGEIVTRGKNQYKKNWLIGIEDPKFIGERSKLLARVKLENSALASSGTYLNFFSENGVTYSHIIDPRTGYPIKLDLISVTVIAKDCMTADALATAAMVLGEQQARELFKDIPDLGIMFIAKKGEELSTSYFKSFKSALLL
jgi:FAD:protein FMN transferase